MNIRSLQDYLPKVERNYKTEQESDSIISSPKNFSFDYSNRIQSQYENSLKVQIKHKLILHNEFQLKMLQQIQRLDVEKKVIENKKKLLNCRVQNMEYKKLLWENVRQRYKSLHQQEKNNMIQMHQTLYDDGYLKHGIRQRIQTLNSENQTLKTQKNRLDSKRYYVNSQKVVYNQYKNEVRKLDKAKNMDIKDIAFQAKVFQKQRPFYKVSELKRKLRLQSENNTDSYIYQPIV